MRSVLRAKTAMAGRRVSCGEAKTGLTHSTAQHRILTIRAKRVAQGLARTNHGRTDEPMDRQSTDREALHAFADTIDIDEQDEHATLV